MSALDDARDAVKGSDRAQLKVDHFNVDCPTLATAQEVRYLRDALRALIQHCENIESQLSSLRSTTSAIDSRTIGMTLLG